MAQLQIDLHELSRDREKLRGSVVRAALLLCAVFVAACDGAPRETAPPPVLGAAPDAAPPPASAGAASLYKRLGGYDAIAAVTDSFLVRVGADTMLNVFFAGIPDSVMRRIRQHVVDQLCQATGGPCYYTGRTMVDSHLTLGITTDVFDRFVTHFESTLVAFNVHEKEQDEVVAALLSMKPDIVTR